MDERVESSPQRRVVAAFDFDRTLTRRDTLLLFFREWCGWRGLGRAAIAEALSVVAAACGGHRRDQAKAALIHRLLGGHLEEAALQVARRVAERILDRELRLDTCARLTWHLSQEHEVVVVSASFEAYVEPVARSLGATAVLATRWEVGEDTRLTGGLAGPNVRGPEKASRLRRYLGDCDALVYAYGNSAGDREMLAVAKFATRVRPYRHLPGHSSLGLLPDCDA